jgi:hypothetical protein
MPVIAVERVSATIAVRAKVRSSMHRLVVVAIIVTGCGEHGTSNPPPVDSKPPVDMPPPPVDMPPPPPDAPSGVTCGQKDDPVILNFTCHVIWSQCTDSSTYDLFCNIQNVGGNVFSLCDCTQNGVKGEQFISTTVCMSTTFEEVEAVVNEKCLWNIH